MEMVADFTNLDNAEVSSNCPVIQYDNHTIQLRLSKRVNIGSPVKLEADDTMALGEVSFCQPEGDGYIVWVELAQALHNVMDLSRLARALLAERL